MNPLKVEHAYSGPEGCYWAPGSEAHVEYDSWADFYDEFGNSSLDMNLVYRWDWRTPDPDGYDSAEDVPDHDLLQVFIVGQRKGTLTSHTIAVTDADADAVRVWLEPRWAHLRALWEPIS